MKLLSYLRCLTAKLFRRRQVSDDMDEELRSHIQLRADDLERSGASRAEAERQARIEFGGRERFKEECHEALGGTFIESVINDARFAVRVLRKSPGFTFAAVGTLALAIGANAVVFSVLNAFIIRPLNVPQAESLYGLWRSPDKDMAESYPDYIDLRDRNRTIEDLAAYNISVAGFDTGGEPSRSWIYEASGNYFDALRLTPYIGRFFHASDEHGPGSAPYIVLSHAFWHTHFKDDTGVVGRKVQVNKHPYTIIGVAPPEFHGTLLFFHPDFFVPLVQHEDVIGMFSNSPGPSAQLENAFEDRGTRWIFMTLGHLKPGVTPARAADRSREVALRLALGSTRRRILRQLFTEAVVISLMGGAVGLMGSIVLLRQLSAWQPFGHWPVHLAVTPDGTVYAVALLLTLASGLLFGAVPVRQILRTSPYEVVKSGATSTSRGRVSVREVLLAVQIAICAVLITSSMVAVRGLARSLHNDFGFQPDNMLLADTDFSMAGYKGDQVAPIQKRMIDVLSVVPGVESVAFSQAVPLGDDSPDSNVFRDDTADLRPANAADDPFMYKVTPDYFRAAGTALLAGRDFTWHDDKNSPRVAVVNPEFARRIFGSSDKAMGRYFKMPDGQRVQVVGIAEQGKYASIDETRKAAMFLPYLQWPETGGMVTVRYRGDPLQVTEGIRSAFRNLDAALPVYIEPRLQQMKGALFGARMATLSLGVLGVMGAMLALIGIFGMAAYSVSKRMRELGIRVALGAKPKEVLKPALGRALHLLAFGSLAGLVLGILASRVLALIVYQATPRDPLVLGGSILTMLLLGLLATWIPAQRALHVDPVNLLREE